MTHTDRTFDWRPNHDPRSRNFRAMRQADPYVRNAWTWVLRNPVLDQGSEGACVGHGTINAASTPRMNIQLPKPQQTAFGMYYGSRFIDEWPGEDYDGTSVNAGCKLAVQFGLADSYAWCFGVEEVAQVVLAQGPVIIGINWYDSMYETGPDGIVHIGGTIVGGHCICIRGFSRRSARTGGPLFQWRNSWGPSYGLGGDAFVTYEDMDQLLQNQGEAAILSPARRTP